jgi:hypothetical protein
MSSKIVNKSPADLRPHPVNKELYGPPTANSKYKGIKDDMIRRGYDDDRPLKITEDGRILWGVTRWAIAKSLNLDKLPCIVFQPKDQATAELEMEAEIVRGNIQRDKTELMIAKEERKLLEVEREMARRRMGQGSDGGPSMSVDRVAKTLRDSGKTVSGKTVQRRLKVLGAIEEAEADGNHRKVERLTELLNAKSITKALDIVNGKTTTKKPPKVETPRTLNECSTKAYSEFYEACARAKVSAEIDILEATLGRMRDDLETARQRL